MTTPNEELRKQLQQIYKSGELYYRVISDTTDLLPSQAERIATLEDDVEFLQEDINAMCNAIPDYRWSGGAAELIAKCFAERDTLRAELDSLAANATVAAADSQKAYMGLLDEDIALRAELADMAVNTATYEHLVDLANDTATRLLKERDTLRAQLADAELHTKQVERGLDKATAQLVEIEKTEPVLIVEKEPDYWSGGHFHEGSKPHIKPTKVWCLPIGTKLFTRPMPANRLTEWKLLTITTAYEQGVGKGIQRRDCNPYAADTDEHAAWTLGYEEGLDKPMPAQDVAELVDCRIELVVAIHSLASNFENILGKIAKDQEAFDKARGDIAHAMKIAERWNWNGTELSKCKGAK